MEEAEFFSFLEKRKGKLDGVVISGGEPTLQPDLEPFIRKIRDAGFHVKLDTNGSNPDVLRTLLDANLLDYVAMDIKAPFGKYEKVIGVPCDEEKIRQSKELLLGQTKVLYEFRTTFVRPFHEISDLIEMARSIAGAPLYVIQRFKREKILGAFQEGAPISDQEFSAIKPELERIVQRSFLR
jgi:pyruvate formate lyase activating enzyme